MSQTKVDHGSRVDYTGNAAVDNEVVIETSEVVNYTAFLLQVITGVVDVFGSLDGVNYTSSPIAMQDLSAIATAPVIEANAGFMYGIVGNYSKLKVLQKGGTAVSVILRGWGYGRN